MINYANINVRKAVSDIMHTLPVGVCFCEGDSRRRHPKTFHRNFVRRNFCRRNSCRLIDDLIGCFRTDIVGFRVLVESASALRGFVPTVVARFRSIPTIL